MTTLGVIHKGGNLRACIAAKVELNVTSSVHLPVPEPCACTYTLHLGHG